MRFMADSYDKLFPRSEEIPEQIETAVPGFTPTSDAVEGKIKEPEQPKIPETVTGPKDPVTIPQPEPVKAPEGEENGDVNSN